MDKKEGELRMTPADVLRLGHKADKDNVQLFHTLGGEYFTRSNKTAPDVVYHTTPESCDCPGFKYVGRCKHIAALVRRT
jgi:hypothetical protein